MHRQQSTEQSYREGRRLRPGQKEEQTPRMTRINDETAIRESLAYGTTTSTPRARLKAALLLKHQVEGLLVDKHSCYTSLALVPCNLVYVDKRISSMLRKVWRSLPCQFVYIHRVLFPLLFTL